MKQPFVRLLFLGLITYVPTLFSQQSHSQETETNYARLDQWPRDLEVDFALSALPPHLRSDATVYVLNPAKGYEVAKKGSNGFVCFVSRTEWEWADSRDDHAAPISYDAAGTAAAFQVYLDVAKWRASGKYTPAQVKKMVQDGFRKERYKAPSRAGVSYMLAPMMRTYPAPEPSEASKQVVSMHMPHYMFYAPNVKNDEIGGKPFSEHPFIFNPGNGPHGYIIVLAGETERNRIIEDQKGLLKRLADFKPYFKVEMQEHQ